MDSEWGAILLSITLAAQILGPWVHGRKEWQRETILGSIPWVAMAYCVHAGILGSAISTGDGPILAKLALLGAWILSFGMFVWVWWTDEQGGLERAPKLAVWFAASFPGVTFVVLATAYIDGELVTSVAGAALGWLLLSDSFKRKAKREATSTNQA